jgi:hypothetical protein
MFPHVLALHLKPSPEKNGPMTKRASVAALALTLSTCSLAANEEFLNQAVKRAREANFLSCDSAVREAFGILSGEAMTVMILPTGSASEIRMIAVFGVEGGPIFHEVKITKDESYCRFLMTGVIPARSGCDGVAAKPSGFIHRVETLGALFSEIESGATRILLPSPGDSCTQIFMASGMKPAD